MAKLLIALLPLLFIVAVSSSFDASINSIDTPDESPRLSKSSLIDDVLSSDYFNDDEISDDAPPAPVDVENVDVDKIDAPPAPVEEIISTSRPFCTGCATEVSTTNPKIQEIASFAFSSHLASFDKAEKAPRVVRISKAQSQIVAGQKYILELEVGLTNCTKGEHDQNPQNCQIDPEIDTFICNFEVVEQSWLNRKEVVRSSCKREGDVGDVDAVAPEISDDALLEDSDEDVDDDIDRTTVGAVADSSDLLSRRKRATGLLGGDREAEEPKEKLMELATFAVKQLDAIDADDDARMVVEILESRKQTVSGWLFTLKLRVAHTTCPESEEVSLAKCKDKIVPPFRICQVKVLVQPWQESQKKVTESQCYPEKYKKGKKMAKELFKKESNDVSSDKKILVGGFTDVDVSSKELQSLVSFVVESIDMQSNALHAQKLVKVVQAQRQIVGGVKTKFVVELGYTQCRKKPKLDKSLCEIDSKREHQFCSVEVWEQPWLKSKQITHTQCGPKEDGLIKEALNGRDKRSLLGHLGEKEFSLEDHSLFKGYLKKYSKLYESNEEYLLRLGIFKENMKKVKLLQDNEQGTGEYGATVFADLTEEEFAKHHLGLRPDLRQNSRWTKKAKIPQVSIPDEFDWRNYDAVTPVKNQGFCGSCWAFSVTGNIEGLYAKKHGQLKSFSEQELVDCDTLDEGCNGGLPENAYKALQKLGGLETESAYKYDGRKENCSFDISKASAKVKGFVEVSKNETEMAAWLVKNGPISIGINANAMQFYFGGVSHPWKFLCSKKSLDHGVLIVGYGVHTTSIRHKTLPYWIVKNSWGTSWGEKGYYRVYRGDNTCGLAEMASSAIVE